MKEVVVVDIFVKGWFWDKRHQETFNDEKKRGRWH